MPHSNFGVPGLLIDLNDILVKNGPRYVMSNVAPIVNHVRMKKRTTNTLCFDMRLNSFQRRWGFATMIAAVCFTQIYGKGNGVYYVRTQHQIRRYLRIGYAMTERRE